MSEVHVLIRYSQISTAAQHICSVYCTKVFNEISTVLGRIESTDVVSSCFTDFSTY